MADDKGGGGVKWEPFEVILVILLLVGLLTKLQSSFKKTPSPTTTASHTTATTSSQKTSAASATCGLTITHPLPSEKVYATLALSGSTNGCNWTSTPTVALYAQVVDGSGKPVSGYIAVPPATVTGTVTKFAMTIPLTTGAATGNGLLILLPAAPSLDQSISYRIPITFSP
ncbi:MAG TPA: hypothetical protein VG621_01380 [Candidatus Paceibacterota bacterium]|nr:hypothetical protein [Candidatus Paceibacterota bacterium]